MGDRERDDMMLQAASMYYLQDETMETIARRFDVSRSTVSRLIHQARATGLVQITVAPQGENGSRDRALLHDTFGVRCHVVSRSIQRKVGAVPLRCFLETYAEMFARDLLELSRMRA